METKNFWDRLCPKLSRIYTGSMTALLLCAALMCNYSYQHEDSDFLAGDHVMLVVYRFEPEKRQMYGKILSKW